MSDDIELGRRIARRLQAEARSALLAWSIVEASGFLLPKDRQKSTNVFSLRWTGAHHDLVVVSLSDTLMTLCRMTDAPGKQRHSLPALYRILCRPDLQSALLLEARGWNDSMLQLGDGKRVTLQDRN